MKFNLVLAALSEETLDRVKALVEMLEQLADPYQALRRRLIDVYEPDVRAQASRILHMRELGDMQLMDNMLALLPNGEQPGILFKSVFLTWLPRDIYARPRAGACGGVGVF